MDQVFASLGFVKCYINDIIILSLNLGNHMHRLKNVFGKLKKHNLKLIIQVNVDFSYSNKTPWAHDLSRWSGGSKGQG
jgi:hypothetical protein